MSFWGELRRRNVVKVAITYAIVGWLLDAGHSAHDANRGPSLDGPTLMLIGGLVVLVVSFTVLLSIYLSVRGVLRLAPSSVLRFA